MKLLSSILTLTIFAIFTPIFIVALINFLCVVSYHHRSNAESIGEEYDIRLTIDERVDNFAIYHSSLCSLSVRSISFASVVILFLLCFLWGSCYLSVALKKTWLVLLILVMAICNFLFCLLLLSHHFLPLVYNKC